MRGPALHSHLWPGVPLALGSAVLFGALPPLSKLLLGSMDPFMLAGLLYLGAGFGLVLYRLGRRIAGRKSHEASLQKSDIPWLAGAIVVGGIAGPVLLMSGLSLTTASSGALLLNLEGLATMVIAWLVFRENANRRLVAGALAILAGAVALSWQSESFDFNTGALLIAGACLAWGIDNNLTRKISAADPVEIVTIKGLTAGSVNMGLAFIMGAKLPALSFVGATAFLGLLGIGVSLVMFVLALRHLGTARTGAYYALAPFIGALLAVVLLAEPVTLKLVLAGFLMGFGLWLHLAERHRHDHAHGVLEHEHSHLHDEHHQHVHPAPVSEPHSHRHRHEPMRHGHPHYPDLHHRHTH